MAIEVILFDADGVIQHATHNWQEAFARTLPFEHSVLAQQFTADIFAAETAYLTRAEGFDKALDDVLRIWRLLDFKSSVVDIMLSIEPYDEIMQVIKTIRSNGIRCFVASNQQTHRANYMTAKFGYATKFDGELYSCNLGAAKPSRIFFERALKIAGANSASTLFIDDRGENIEGAIETGLQVILYDGCDGVQHLRSRLSSFGIET